MTGGPGDTGPPGGPLAAVLRHLVEVWVVRLGVGGRRPFPGAPKGLEVTGWPLEPGWWPWPGRPCPAARTPAPGLHCLS